METCKKTGYIIALPNRVIRKVTLCFTPWLFGFAPYPLSEWYPQSNEIFIKSGYEMLKLSIWCTRFESIYSSCTGRSSENICSSNAVAQEKGNRAWNSVYHPNLWKNQFGSQLFPFVKFSFPITRLMPYYAETGRSYPLIVAWLYG